MATIEKLPSGSYRARVHVGGGKYKSITRQTKKEVQLEAAKLEAMRDDAQSSMFDMTLGEAMERYIQAKSNVLSPTTIRSYKQIKDNYFLELQPLKLKDITQEKVQVAINVMAASSSPKSVRNRYILVTAALKMYYPERKFNISLPQKVKHEIIIPTEDEVMALLKESRDKKIEPAIYLAALAGMRRSEIAGLKWSRVDFENRTITIDNAVVYSDSSTAVDKGTKSVSSQRKIKVLPEVLDVLKKYYNPENEYVVDMLPNEIYYRFKRLLRKACPERDYTLHELRHYACSVMIMLGIPNKYIADYLGHSTENMVNQVYGHVMRDKKDMIFERLETYYSTALKNI